MTIIDDEDDEDIFDSVEHLFTAVQESLMAPFFDQKCPNHVVFDRL